MSDREITFLNKTELMKKYPDCAMIAIYLNGKRYVYKNKFGYTYIVSCILPVGKDKKAMTPVYPSKTYFSIKVQKKDFIKCVILNKVEKTKNKEG